MIPLLSTNHSNSSKMVYYRFSISTISIMSNVAREVILKKEIDITHSNPKDQTKELSASEMLY